MKNKTSQKAEFVKNITDRYEEIGELYKVGSDFYVVKWYSDEYPYGLMGEAEEEIQLLRKERDEARRLACKNAGILRCVVDPDQDIEEWAKSVAWLNKWDCYREETK